MVKIMVKSGWRYCFRWRAIVESVAEIEAVALIVGLGALILGVEHLFDADRGVKFGIRNKITHERIEHDIPVAAAEKRFRQGIAQLPRHQGRDCLRAGGRRSRRGGARSGRTPKAPPQRSRAHRLPSGTGAGMERWSWSCPPCGAQNSLYDPVMGSASTEVAGERVPRCRALADGRQWQRAGSARDCRRFRHLQSALQGLRRYRRAQGQLGEQICAEENFLLFDYGVPIAKTPDFELNETRACGGKYRYRLLGSLTCSSDIVSNRFNGAAPGQPYGL